MPDKIVILKSFTNECKTSCGKFFVTVGFDKNQNVKYINMSRGKSGACMYTIASYINNLYAQFLNNLTSDEVISIIKKSSKLNRYCLSGLSSNNEYSSCLNLFDKAVISIVESVRGNDI